MAASDDRFFSRYWRHQPYELSPQQIRVLFSAFPSLVNLHIEDDDYFQPPEEAAIITNDTRQEIQVEWSELRLTYNRSLDRYTSLVGMKLTGFESSGSRQPHDTARRFQIHWNEGSAINKLLRELV